MTENILKCENLVAGYSYPFCNFKIKCLNSCYSQSRPKLALFKHQVIIKGLTDAHIIIFEIIT